MRNLLSVLQRLADGGNTVVVIEHHLDVVLNADHIIDLGPSGGHRGGQIVAEGTPEQVAAHPTSLTGEHLRPAFARRGIVIPPSPAPETKTKALTPKTKRRVKAKVAAK